MFGNRGSLNIGTMWIIIPIAILLLILIPRNISKLVSQPDPVRDYKEAISRTDSLREKGAQDMNPLCRLQLMSCNRKVDRAVHGYISCPQQFHELGKRFNAFGDNVVLIASL